MKFPNKFNTATPEGRKALRLATVSSKALVDRLALGALEGREKLPKAALCHMAVDAGLTLRDFI